MGGVTIVVGPPCGGKSTHVEAAARAGDVRIDYDRLAIAFGAPTSHGTEGAVRRVTFAARAAAIDEVLAGVDSDAWIIHTSPTEEQRAKYEAAGASFVNLDPGMDVCLQRAAAAKRPDASIQRIYDWYAAGTKAGTRMDVIRKDATIVNTDEDFPGSFEVVLSAPTKDRDGDTLLPDEWKQPLPDHVTFDMDHGMSVATTVGSGRPRLEADGTLRVSGTYSSLPRAQEVRTLVKEGHINRTSVAFMSEKTQKDGVTAVTRELLNGAFVAVPSNREAVILESKGLLEAKTGKRNSAKDQEHLDAIARHAVALGATFKSADDPQGGDTGADEDVAAAKSLTRKDADTEDASDPVALISATDAAIDQAIDLLAQVDATTLPAEVQQAIALIQAADATVDELLDALGIPDPDEDAETADTTATAAKAAAADAAAEAERIDIIRKAAEARFSLLTERN